MKRYKATQPTMAHSLNLQNVDRERGNSGIARTSKLFERGSVQTMNEMSYSSTVNTRQAGDTTDDEVPLTVRISSPKARC